MLILPFAMSGLFTAATSAVLMLGIAALSAYGFYASRGDEPLFGRVLLD